MRSQTAFKFTAPFHYIDANGETLPLFRTCAHAELGYQITHPPPALLTLHATAVLLGVLVRIESKFSITDDA